LYSLLLSLFVGLVLVLVLEFYGFDLIKFIFMRGEFNINDVVNTNLFIQNLSYSFVLIFIATTLFQPFFSLSIDSSRKVRRNISILFIITIVSGFIFSLSMNLPVKTESFIMIYSSSIMSVILSAYSFVYYLKQNK
jgi:peptidoglycan biosynthesis protein MviN/MurJ (putative lipid II flippase)